MCVCVRGQRLQAKQLPALSITPCVACLKSWPRQAALAAALVSDCKNPDPLRNSNPDRSREWWPQNWRISSYNSDPGRSHPERSGRCGCRGLEKSRPASDLSLRFIHCCGYGTSRRPINECCRSRYIPALARVSIIRAIMHAIMMPDLDPN
eukprot:COSAG02_NODE_87_length_38906_cov_69.688697_8_plen_151_part_00